MTRVTCFLLCLVCLALAEDKFNSMQFVDKDDQATDYLNLTPKNVEDQHLEYHLKATFTKEFANKLVIWINDTIVANCDLDTNSCSKCGVLADTDATVTLSNSDAILTLKGSALDKTLATQLEGHYKMELKQDTTSKAISEEVTVYPIVYCSSRPYIPADFELDEDKCELFVSSGCDEWLYQDYRISQAEITNGNDVINLEYDYIEEGDFFVNLMNQTVKVDEGFPKGEVKLNVWAVQGERNGNVTQDIDKFNTKACANFLPYCAGNTSTLPPLSPMTASDLDPSLTCQVSQHRVHRTPCRGEEIVPAYPDQPAVLTFTCRQDCLMTWSEGGITNTNKTFVCGTEDMMWRQPENVDKYPSCKCGNDAGSLGSSLTIAFLAASLISAVY